MLKKTLLFQNMHVTTPPGAEPKRYSLDFGSPDGVRIHLDLDEAEALKLAGSAIEVTMEVK